MVRKELSEGIFRKCFNDKINLFEKVSGTLEVKTFADGGSGNYFVEVSLDFGGPFTKKSTIRGYDSRREADKEAVDSALENLRRIVYPHLVSYNAQKGEVTINKSFRVA